MAWIPFSMAAYAQAPYTSLDVRAFRKLVNKDKALLIDVRTPEEFAAGHIEAAANLDWRAGTLIADLSGIDKTKPVLLYCEGGIRSGEAMEAMKKVGFTDIHDLKGGFAAWKSDKQPVITQ